jgi:hypothetical protein
MPESNHYLGEHGVDVHIACERDRHGRRPIVDIGIHCILLQIFVLSNDLIRRANGGTEYHTCARRPAHR